LIVKRDQEIEIWGMQIDEEAYQIAFDCGDNGFVKLDRRQLETLADVTRTLLRKS
jgi:hypothetical protein